MTDPDPFDDIIAGEFTESVDTTTMTALELSSAYSKVRTELLELEEMLEARTDRGRELHVQRAALIFALREQHLMG